MSVWSISSVTPAEAFDCCRSDGSSRSTEEDQAGDDDIGPLDHCRCASRAVVLLEGGHVGWSGQQLPIGATLPGSAARYRMHEEIALVTNALQRPDRQQESSSHTSSVHAGTLLRDL